MATKPQTNKPTMVVTTKPKHIGTGAKKPTLSPPRAKPQSPKGKTKPDNLSVVTPAPEDDGRGVPQRSSDKALTKHSTSPSAGPEQDKSETVSDLHSGILDLALAEAMPEEASDEHVIVAYIRRMNQAEAWASKKIALLQWRQGFILNRAKEKHQGDWTAWAEASLPYGVRTALNHRDLAAYFTEEEARTSSPTELYDQIAVIKAEKKKLLTPDGLIKTLKTLRNETLALAKVCEEDDQMNLKQFYEEPGAELIRKLDQHLEHVGAIPANLKRIEHVLRSIRRQVQNAAEAE